ncbi:hypothetical protein AAG589_01645 [Isoptericola sp. F-RaC21]|uniref:hypothetical protein n=1 Tax=Isoptericola sp. F-RaC21 TaxID=3141452 RepID=UPI00315C43FC
MNEYLYYDEFRVRQADLERAVRREAESRVGAQLVRRERRARRREVARRRRAERRPWELPGGLVRPWPQ